LPLIESEAIVLNSLKLGESDKLVTFYTRDRGKIKAVAKGARKLKNKFGSSLEPFSFNRLVVFDKNARFLYRLYQSDIIDSFLHLRSDYDKILIGSRFLVCLESLTPEGDPAPEIFDLLLKFLESGKSNRMNSGLLNLFKVKLLGYSGYEFALQNCVRCRLGGNQSYLSPLLGGMLCSSCARQHATQTLSVSLPAMSVLRQIFKMDHELLARIKPSEEVVSEIEHILNVFIFHLLGKKLPTF